MSRGTKGDATPIVGAALVKSANEAEDILVRLVNYYKVPSTTAKGKPTTITRSTIYEYVERTPYGREIVGVIEAIRDAQKKGTCATDGP